MNTSFIAVAFFIILLGGISGFYPISLLGIILLIAAFLAPSKPVPRRAPIPQGRVAIPTRQTPTRSTSQQPAQTKMKEEVQLPPSAPTQTMFPQASNQGYASNMALFPASMFPSMVPMPAPAQAPAEVQKQPAPPPESRDELVEMGAILVFLKLLSG